MPYGQIKVDNITFTNVGADQATTVSGIYRAITSGVTVTGTISGTTIQGATVSGTTVTGTTANFTSGNFIALNTTSTTVTSGIFASGLSTAPSISFTSDPNTGFWSPANETLAISNNGTETLRTDSSQRLLVGVTSGNVNGGVLQLKSGITFPAADVAATDANTLDDYEEGTWTPTVFMNGTTSAYSTQSGLYRKIGSVVYVSFTVVTSSFTFTSASADLLVPGLPFAAANNFGGGVYYFQGLSLLAGYTQVGVRSQSGNSFLAFNRSGSGASTASVTSTSVTSGTNIHLSGQLFYTI